MTGTRSIDQMVEAAIWLMVQGDRAGAEELLAQVLRIDPTHERARQAMKSTGAQTTPGQAAPQAPIPNQTNPIIPPGVFKLPESRTPVEPNPALEPRKAEPRVSDMTLPPGRGDLPFVSSPSSTALPSDTQDPAADEPDPVVEGSTTDEVEKPTERRPTLKGSRPPVETVVTPPAASPEVEKEKTDRHLTLVPPTLQPTTSSTQPQLKPVAERVELGSEPIVPSTGTARALKPWSLEVLTGPHTGKVIPLNKRNMMIGRGLGALDVDDDPFVSSGHASFVQRQGDLYVSDGGSTSGTWVTIDVPTRLAPGEHFSAGLQRLKYLGVLDNAASEVPWPYGAPRPAASWRLEHVLVGNRGGRVWVLRGVVNIGRDGTQLRFPDDDSMAMNHVELRPAGEALEIIDRSARAGTFVAVPSGGERKLSEGARIRIGATIFRVTLKV